jgi:hypothetical protein
MLEQEGGGGQQGRQEQSAHLLLDLCPDDPAAAHTQGSSGCSDHATKSSHPVFRGAQPRCWAIRHRTALPSRRHIALMHQPGLCRPHLVISSPSRSTTGFSTLILPPAAAAADISLTPASCRLGMHAGAGISSVGAAGQRKVTEPWQCAEGESRRRKAYALKEGSDGLGAGLLETRNAACWWGEQRQVESLQRNNRGDGIKPHRGALPFGYGEGTRARY